MAKNWGHVLNSAVAGYERGMRIRAQMDEAKRKEELAKALKGAAGQKGVEEGGTDLDELLKSNNAFGTAPPADAGPSMADIGQAAAASVAGAAKGVEEAGRPRQHSRPRRSPPRWPPSRPPARHPPRPRTGPKPPRWPRSRPPTASRRGTTTSTARASRPATRRRRPPIPTTPRAPCLVAWPMCMRSMACPRSRRRCMPRRTPPRSTRWR